MDIQQQTKFEFGEISEGFRTIYKYTKGFRGKLSLIFFLIIVSSVIDAVTPYLWGKLVDAIISRKILNIGSVIILEVFAIFGVYILLLLIQLFADLKKSLEAKWVEENIRIEYMYKGFEHVFMLPMSFHKSSKQGETTEKIRNAATAIRDIFSNAILESIPDLITSVAVCIFVFISNWKFGIIILISYLLFIFISLKEMRPTVELSKESQKGYRKAGGLIQDAVNNIKSVKDFNTEKYEVAKIREVYEKEGLSVWYKLFRIQRTTNSAQGFIRIITRTLIVLLSILLISQGKMTIGTMVAYISYIGLIFTPLTFVFNYWRNVQSGIVSINEAEKVITMQTENYIPNRDTHAIKGLIEFKHVDFYYSEDAPVLKKIDFKVNAGETIALVGESGVGKSTLIELLSGFHFATKGEVLVDGVDVRTRNLNDLRRSIGVVSQEISLFNDTIKNNIAYGSFNRSFAEIEAAARKAHCLDFILKFPEQWEQMVGEKGLKLSVGQKQRVAIARAILKDPKILILDEPTSALDAGSEKIITESLNELMKGKTTFIVAHRLSTVRRADTILVFKNGEIVEKGNHEELIRIEGGEYRRLYELQIGLHN